jgi:hypothetical protein
VLPELLLALFARSLVGLGGGEYTRSLLSSLPGTLASSLPGKRASPWWWEPLDDRMRQLAEDLHRHGQPAQANSARPEEPALALVQALSAAGRQKSDPHVPAWLLEVIENELSGSRKLAGLTALASWMAAAYRQAAEGMLELSMEAMATAPREGLWGALLYVAGLAPLLYAAGGPAQVADMSRRVESIQDKWIKRM